LLGAWCVCESGGTGLGGRVAEDVRVSDGAT
jgi:hypothetical protein